MAEKMSEWKQKFIEEIEEKTSGSMQEYGTVEYEIETLYRETWRAVLPLLRQYEEVYFIGVNSGDIVSEKPEVTTYAFNFALAADREYVEKIKKEVEGYRRGGWTNPADAARRIDKITKLVTKKPHVIGYWR